MTFHLIHTIGDPSGIGPEITARFLAGSYLEAPFPLTVIGHLDGLRRCAQYLQLTLPRTVQYPVEYVAIERSIPDALPGEGAYQSLVRAVQWIKHLHQTQPNTPTALVTGPINKSRLHQAGHAAGGHTEILEALANQFFPHPQNGFYQSDMVFVYQNFRVLLLTRHIPLKHVGKVLEIQGAVRSITQLTDYLAHYGHIHTPRYALFGINPHAGEVGGDEETTLLQPIIQGVHAQTKARMTGPLAADGAVRGLNPSAPPYDAYIAPYHDQGLIPMKLLAGHRAVNVTVGLPFLRTSVSHGTADAIVGLGVAQPESLIAAMKLAQRHLAVMPEKRSLSPLNA